MGVKSAISAAALLGLFGFSAPASATGVADLATSRFLSICQGEVTNPEPRFECALSATVDAGIIATTSVADCRKDLGTGQSTAPNQTLWHCARLRQFGSQARAKELDQLVKRVCEERSRRAGHPYRNRRAECEIDTILEYRGRSLSNAAVQACRDKARPGYLFDVSNCLISELGRADGPVRSVDECRKAAASRGLRAKWMRLFGQACTETNLALNEIETSIRLAREAEEAGRRMSVP